MESYFEHIDPDSMHDFTITGDSALDNLLHEVEIVKQDVHDFTLPDAIVISAVSSASDFFGLPHPTVINSESTCEFPNDPSTYNDDIIGFARKQMMEMGIYGEDALGLVMTHECCHRALQNYGNLDHWEHELACDYFAGIRATLQNMDTSHFENSLINSSGGETHPTGSLRVNFIEYGKQVAAQMQSEGIQPTFENCLETFNRHLIEEEKIITQHHEAVKVSNAQSEQILNGQLSFTGKYSDAEINRMKEDVQNYEYEVSNLSSKVHHHENMVSLSNTPKGHSNGDYADEVSDLNRAKSEYNNAVSRLNNAKSKLNNAI